MQAIRSVSQTSEFCHTGSISLCIDLFVFICVYFVCFCFILHCERDGMDLMGLNSNP